MFMIRPENYRDQFTITASEILRKFSKFIQPVLKFLMATFLDSADFRQKQQLQREEEMEKIWYTPGG